MNINDMASTLAASTKVRSLICELMEDVREMEAPYIKRAKALFAVVYRQPMHSVRNFSLAGDYVRFTYTAVYSDGMEVDHEVNTTPAKFFAEEDEQVAVAGFLAYRKEMAEKELAKTSATKYTGSIDVKICT